MRFHSLGTLLLLGLLAGCGTTQSRTGLRDGSLVPRRIVADGSGVLIDLPAEVSVNTTELPGTPQRIFPLVAAAYDELGIPIETLQTASFMLGNTSFRARRSIGGIDMTRIVDCGSTNTGQRAASNTITFNIITQVRAVDPSKVAIETSLTAIARSIDGASSNPVNCSTLGALEQRITAEVQRRAGN
jgi:hypothetical protein